MGMFSKKDIDDIIDMYVNHNQNTVQIASVYKCNNTTIGKLLRRNGVDVKSIGNARKCKIFTEAESKDICEKYIEGYTSVELGKMYNCADSTITKLLRQNNIPVRRSVRRSIVKKHDYFKCIDTPNKAYFLGLLISDGSVVKQTRDNRTDVISLSLKLEDKYIVEKFALELGADKSSVKEYISKGRSECYFRFASQSMSDDLANYGIISNKTDYTYLPKIEDELIPHLIRGIFDGDGTAYVYKNGNYEYIRFGFYGSYELCKQINEILNNKIQINKNKITKKVGCYMISWQGNDAARKFCEYIYTNDDVVCLTRKRTKLENNIC